MTSARPLRALDDPPGGVLFWLIVGLELVAFAIVLGLVAALRRADPVGFHEVHVALDPRLGLALTALLFGSGWAVAEAVHAFRHDAIARARRAYVLGLVLGLGFVVLKVWDFVHKVQAGHGLGASDAWDAYLLATGFHFAHVVVALVMLGWVALRVGRARFEDPETSVAGTALFWHMCDVAWIFLFPLFFAA
ncbi:MAG: cytochrome c oxidase subunit 3 [Sandaracinus sp.]